MKPTLSLCMITKNEVEDVERILHFMDPYIDEACITITSKEREKEYKEKIKNPKVKWSYFKWVDDFSKARNFNFEQATGEYIIWLDCDDDVDNVEKIPSIIKHMQENLLDIVYLPYNYAQNEDGECIAIHDRDRIVRRNAKDIKWVGIIHETLIGSNVRGEKLREVVVRHRKTPEDVQRSARRNHVLLLKDYKKTKDPRTAHYLGMSFSVLKDYENAIKYLLEHIKSSGWDEEKYRSWIKIAECHILTENSSKANAAVNAAIDLLPDYPEAYWTKCEVAFMEKKYPKVIEWLKTGLTKSQPETLSIIDPSKRVRACIEAAISYAYEGKPKDAYLLLKDILEEAPNNSWAKKMYPIFEYGYLESKYFDYITWISMFYNEHDGNMTKLLQSMPPNLLNDVRSASLRAKYLPTTKWAKKSIVFYCGKSLEVWGAETLDKGMGGSEEAILYLSRELARQGWQVTVYNERDEEYVDIVRHSTDFKDGELVEDEVKVEYKPWAAFNPQDEFDVLVAWRNPSFHRVMQTKARIRAVDFHDTPTGHQSLTPEDLNYIDKVFIKSQFQADLSDTPIPKEKLEIIPNAIQKEHFNV